MTNTVLLNPVIQQLTYSLKNQAGPASRAPTMDNVLTHKGYFSIVKYSPESEIFYGKIEAIVDLVTYEGETAKEVKAAFEEAVESYLETCAEVGKKPDKPYTGTFNVRVNTELHRKAAILSKQRNISLNQLIGEALARYVGA